MICRHIRKVAVEDGREVEYRAELLLTRVEVEHLAFGYPLITDKDFLALNRLAGEIDTADRDVANGRLTEEGQQRYSHLKVIHPGVPALREERPTGGLGECER